MLIGWYELIKRFVFGDSESKALSLPTLLLTLLLFLVILTSSCVGVNPSTNRTPPIEPVNDAGQFFVRREATGYDKRGIASYKDTFIPLTVVGIWAKDNSEQSIPLKQSRGIVGYYWPVNVHISKAPWVINWSYQVRERSPLEPIDSTKPDVWVTTYRKADFDKYAENDPLGLMSKNLGEQRGVSKEGVASVVFQEAGDYVVVIRTTKPDDISNWLLKVGVSE